MSKVTVSRLWQLLEGSCWDAEVLHDAQWRRMRRQAPALADQMAAERRRLSRMGRYERDGEKTGATCIAGIDEVGRGPMAGPLVAAAVVFHRHPWIIGLNDSKQLTPEERRRLRDRIVREAASWAIGEVSVEEMHADGLNMHGVNILALERAWQGLGCRPDLLLIDGRFGVRADERQTTIVKGDCLSYSIAAASIVAKVYRDDHMERLHQQYPQYGFDSHKGYITPDHLKALAEHGPSPVHRPQFRRVREAAGV